MNYIFTIYSVLFIATSLVSFFVAILAFQRRTVAGAIELAWLMFAAGLGALMIIFETAATVVPEKIFWTKLEYIGGVATPVLYLIFVLRFTGKYKLLSITNILGLFIIPAITMALVFTNEKHNLIWSGFSPISPKTNLMEYYHGMWFWIGYIAYSYFLLLISAIFLIQFIITQSGTFRAQALIVMTGGFFPWIVSVIYLTGKSPVPALDLTPFSITLSGTLAVYAILYFRFLDLVPVARETLVEILPYGILALDSQNRIQDINEAAKSFLGIGNKNLIGVPASASGAIIKPLLEAAIGTNTADNIEIRETAEIRTYNILRQTIKGAPGSRLVIIRDITEMKKAEADLLMAKERAEESDRLKSAFLANMSHEIRTPLNGILGFAELLKLPDLTGEEQTEYLEIIRKGGDRMLNIINDIIDISKIESGQMKVSISNTRINEQLHSLYEFFMPEAHSKGIRLIYNNNLSGKDAILETDTGKVSAVVTNLVKNAIKFTPKGFVEFGFENKIKYFEFFVKDTGIGIADNQKEFIFDRFRQGSDSLTRDYEGTGLGLSISKAFVEMLGGRIWYQSEYGKGSEFRFIIPVASQSDTKNIVAETFTLNNDDYKIKHLVVLIVEDDKPSEFYISKLLHPFSKKILKAETGRKAVDLCRNNPDIDLVLMDIKLPGMDGYEATRQIRQFNKEIIIIAQTAFGLSGDREKALESGCNDYISKPLQRNLFLNLIQKYFRNIDLN